MTKIMTPRIEYAIDRLLAAFGESNKSRTCNTIRAAIENLEVAVAQKAGRPRVEIADADVDACINAGITSGAEIARRLGCSQPTVSRFLRNRKLQRH